MDYTVKSLKDGSIRFAAEQPENGKNHPRNLFIWRSNLLGSSGKGHEYMLKYLLGTENGIQGKDLGRQGGVKPEEVEWKDNGLDGKLDLVVTLTSVCPVPACIPISCCQPRPGTKKTT